MTGAACVELVRPRSAATQLLCRVIRCGWLKGFILKGDKYELDLSGEVKIEMPGDAQVLSIQNQNDKIMVWALVDPDQPKETRTYEIYGTGNPIDFDENWDRDRLYIATVQIRQFVWHIFERFED